MSIHQSTVFEWKLLTWILSVFICFSCESPRENALVIVYEADSPLAEDIGRIMSEAISLDLTVDTVSFTKERSGDNLWHNKGIILLADPNHLSPQWQTDIQRFIQSGGGMMVPDVEVNKYQWPWLFEAKANDGLNYDGGKIAFFKEAGDLNSAFIQTSLAEHGVNEHDIKTLSAPDESRFTKIVLDADVNEPMELEILPDGKIIFIEREGNFKLYDPADKRTKILHTFHISTQGNYEDGMLGLAIDPNYEKNHWVYIYYSPYGGAPRQNLSRFVLIADSLLVESEKVVLEVLVQRETCCHSGGSIMFGPEGNLYLSTGDNTSSKESSGYSPLDERPGRAPFDSQKSSSNTNDLRGKILRITPTKDGSYTIPKGNLFPSNGSQGRPEIYAMGVRSPFRFTVDQKTGYLYWGDVGPDSGKDSEKGPQSYDEWNQARTAGNYGWPYFEADNKAFPMIDFATDKIGPPQDPEHPINNSPNNTGIRELPSARESMIWYPYGASDIWPMLGTGSRSAMSGPVYYKPAGHSKVAFPEHYDGKLFIYEWARSWIKVVSFDEDWNLTKIEPFLPGETFSKPIDMEFDRHGAMYLLEYGANYFANNPDAKLVKIEYTEGNRLPVPSIMVDRTRGASPLTVQFSAEGSYDYDAEDSLSFTWIYSDKTFNGQEVSITFDAEGEHQVELVVSDSKGETASSFTHIQVGNEPSNIALDYSGNQSFYFGAETNSYKVTVTDKEDGSTNDATIAKELVNVSFTYLHRDNDLALLGEDFFRNPTINAAGKNLIENSDCASCHALDQKSIGPTYQEIAKRYSDDPNASDMLATKIVNGGGGNWGQSLMAAHPQLTIEQTTEMVDYILSLANKTSTGSLSLEGNLIMDQPNAEDRGTYVLGMRYTDKGNGSMAPIETSKITMIKAPVLEAEHYDLYNDVQQQRPNGGSFAFLSNINHLSYIGYQDIDLKGVKKMTLNLMPFKGGEVKAVIGKPDGQVIGRVTIQESRDREWQSYDMVIEGSHKINDLYFVFEHPTQESHLMSIDRIDFSN